MSDKLQACIDQIIIALNNAKVAIAEMFPAQPIQAQNVAIAPIASVVPISLEDLKSALSNGQWPDAVNKHLICDPTNISEKIERGKGIIDLMIEEDLKGLKFLDFGCGEGYTISYASEKATPAVGYDTKQYDTWGTFPQTPNSIFTTDWLNVVKNGPYNVILCFDVIDHLTGDVTALHALQQMESVLAADGKIYLRTHPFTSRHATHLYHDLNKAFLHLVFTPEELQEIITPSQYAEPNTGMVKYPIKTYNDLINKAKLTSLNAREIKEPVEEFFKTPAIAQRIINNVQMGTELPLFQMSLQFIDMVLKKADIP